MQGVGAAFLIANSVAILTDAFPANQRGLALGINNVVGISGMFIGLVLGGLLAPISWRLIFLVSVPFGLAGTIWSYRSLRETGTRRPARIDWVGTLTFTAGTGTMLAAITYGIQPYGGHVMGWTSPTVLTCLIGGVLVQLAAVRYGFSWAVNRRAVEGLGGIAIDGIIICAIGTLSLTSRHSAAFFPSINSPVSVSHIASRMDSRSTTTLVTPPPGNMPQLISDRPYCASSAEMARSQAKSGPKPPPKHQPLTIAIVGFWNQRSRRNQP